MFMLWLLAGLVGAIFATIDQKLTYGRVKIGDILGAILVILFGPLTLIFASFELAHTLASSENGRAVIRYVKMFLDKRVF